MKWILLLNLLINPSLNTIPVMHEFDDADSCRAALNAVAATYPNNYHLQPGICMPKSLPAAVCTQDSPFTPQTCVTPPAQVPFYADPRK